MTINNDSEKRRTLAVSWVCNASKTSIPTFFYCHRMRGFSSPPFFFFLIPAVHVDSSQLDAVHRTLIPASLGDIVRQKIGCAIFSDREMNPRRLLCGLSR